jgi:hypothetical protein
MKKEKQDEDIIIENIIILSKREENRYNRTSIISTLYYFNSQIGIIF